MLPAPTYKTTLFFVFSITLLIACGKRDVQIDQKLIGTWRSTETITQVFEENQLTDSYLFKSNQHSFSILAFDGGGHFTSSGQYADPEADSLNVIILSPQQGNYRVEGHKLFTKLAELNKEAELALTFNGYNKLTLVTRAIRSLDNEKRTRHFISNTTYIRVK